jgi:phosphohistidine phosphatase
MKDILLLRHAKSDWNVDFGEDHERPLANRGRRAAGRLGRLLEATSSMPDVIFTSTAVRAADTALLLHEAAGWPNLQIHRRGDLYGAGVDRILALTRELPEEMESALFVGHEPGWSQAVSALSGGSSVRMPTACLACISFDVPEWSLCLPGRGVLTRLIPPRALD